MTLRIANAAGFLGDQLDAPRRLVEQAEVDFLTLEYLAELTLSILARQREKDASKGHAQDFLTVAKSLCSALYLQPQLHVVTNAGGMNPLACVHQVGKILSENGSEALPLAAVTGDDLLDRLEELLAAGATLENLDTGQPFSELKKPVVSANAYLGAAPIAEALRGGARMIVTGRVADASLTVGPAVHHFGWDWDDWDRLAGASVAGHLIECGAQVTGGYSTVWQDSNLTEVGYPIALVEEDASSTITKPEGTGGRVTRMSVVEQLIYEIGDPGHYLTPDVDVDFTSVEVQDQGDDRVVVRGASGNPAPESYKVSLAYHDGFTAGGQLLVYGRDCVEKAKACGEMVFARVRQAGFELKQTSVELLGAGEGVPGLVSPPKGLSEVMLRLTVRDSKREAVERFTKELAPLITSGPAGLSGYATGRSAVRPVFAYWPTLIAKEALDPSVEVRTAKEWSKSQ